VSVLSVVPLRYVDGKRLMGIGTRASKSRLTSVQCRRTLLECLSTCRKEDKKGSLASLGWKKEREESVCVTLLSSSFRLRREERIWRGFEMARRRWEGELRFVKGRVLGWKIEWFDVKEWRREEGGECGKSAW
jgi:hypothetical protein